MEQQMNTKKNRNQPFASRGFTLVEVILSMTLLAVIMTFISTAFLMCLSSFSRTTAANSKSTQAAAALEQQKGNAAGAVSGVTSDPSCSFQFNLNGPGYSGTVSGGYYKSARNGMDYYGS